jgi:hypothetical protein
MSWTLTPAYGRDYKSRDAALAAFHDDLDWIDNSFQGSGKPIGRPDLVSIATEAGKPQQVKLRYWKNMREVTVQVSPESTTIQDGS